MYQKLKSAVKKIVPTDVLWKNEEAFRYFYGILYSGSSYTCTICEHNLRSFVFTFGSKQLCPYCGSLARTRRLYHLLNYEMKLTGNVLHFSPSRSLYRRLRENSNITYYSTDFENEFLAQYRFDITNIAIENDFFDFIICYHILEHIPDDHKAMKELYRVLKPGGHAIIQTPFKTGDTYEDLTITSPEERLKHFGQDDHVRIYSIAGLTDRLRINGFETIEVQKYEQDDFGRLHGFLDIETVITVKKTNIKVK